MKKKRRAVASAASSGDQARPAKKRKAAPIPEKDAKRDEEIDEDDDAEEDEEEQDSDKEITVEPSADGTTIDVDFEFMDPSDDDYHSVSGLLKSGTWEFVELNFSELSDSAVGQGNIGTLVKSNTGSEDDITVCAFHSTLNLRQFAQQSWPRDVTRALVAKAQKHAGADVASRFEAAIEHGDGKSKEVGLLLSDRFANLPPALVPPLHKALIEDIDWSCTTPDCPEDERPFYKFTHFLGVCKCFAPPGTPFAADASSSSAAAPAGMKKKKKKAAAASAAKGASSDYAESLNFPHAEFGAYAKHASMLFTFPCQAEGKDKPKKAGGAQGQERRAVFVLTRSELEEAVLEIQVMYGSDE
eukprot:TRINITY_DN63630_c0_g1_i1.p1 TRINITY_DN63630_c0_g1~~TRINITY_DN63630_c0_g1_i1.p1  ORF type:complete len:357 (+),score=90.74 TRINITY_DN63630_c0_g1_i1:76-1146(+)